MSKKVGFIIFVEIFRYADINVSVFVPSFEKGKVLMKKEKKRHVDTGGNRDG